MILYHIMIFYCIHMSFYSPCYVCSFAICGHLTLRCKVFVIYDRVFPLYSDKPSCELCGMIAQQCLGQCQDRLVFVGVLDHTGSISPCQWAFQDPKMEVLYHI